MKNFLSSVYPYIRLLALVSLFGCGPYLSKHYKAESFKAQTVCPQDYKYTEPVSPKKSLSLWLSVAIPLSIPFIIISSTSSD